MIRVALIGCGTIGAAVAERVLARADRYELAGTLARTRSVEGVRAFASIDELLAARPRVVVEAASREAVAEHGEAVLRAGADLLIVSTGALADDGLRERLAAAGRESGTHVRVASGGTGALDVLTAFAVGGLDRVVVEQRKPPRALLEPEEADALTGPRVVYEGTARDAVARFPKTTNVTATVALAGIGLDRTIARVVADPGISAIQAVVEADGPVGSIRFRLENAPTRDPRTSATSALAVVAALDRVDAPLILPA